MNQLFIPDRIRVGFVKRNDCFEKKLAYVIYYDKKGVLRKEKSWESWRDKTIDPVELDNKPHSGFTLNKDVHRGGGDWFSVGRNHIRIHDDRGIEFEITPENLIFILMHTNCVKRCLEGEFVYSWLGTDLVLLPVDCPEYKKSMGYTELQGGKVGVKSLVPGCWYTTKKQEEYLYLGRFTFYAWQGYNPKTRVGTKQFVFLSKKDVLMPFKSLSSFAAKISEPVEDFATKLDLFLSSPNNCPLESIAIVDDDTPVVEPSDFESQDYYYYYDNGARIVDQSSVMGWTRLSDNEYRGIRYFPIWRKRWDQVKRIYRYAFLGYCTMTWNVIASGDNFRIDTVGSEHYSFDYGNATYLTLPPNLRRQKLMVKFTNFKEFDVTKI